MTAEEIRSIARRLIDVKLQFEVQDRRSLDEAHNALYRIAAEEDDRSRWCGERIKRLKDPVIKEAEAIKKTTESKDFWSFATSVLFLLKRD